MLVWFQTQAKEALRRTEVPVELDGQAEVGDAACAIFLHQDVLAFQVSVGDGRFALRAVDLCV